MKDKLLYPLFYIIALYNFFRTRHYYISGTGLTQDTNERMFFKVVFATKGQYLPIKSIEQNVIQQLKLKSCVVLHFVKISRTMSVSMNETDKTILEHE